MPPSITPEQAAAELARRRAAAVQDEPLAAAQAPAITREDVLRELARRKGQKFEPEKVQKPKKTRTEAAKEAGRRVVGADKKGFEALKGQLVAAAIGAGGGAFEATNALLRADIKKRFGVSDDEARDLADAALGEAARARPGAFAVGYGAGAIGSGGALVKGAQAAGRAIPAVGRVVQAAAPVIGKPVSNAAKLAAGGGAGAGVAEANRGRSAEEVAAAAGIGAVASPAIAAVARAAGAGVNFARSAVNKNSEEGFRVLAKQMRRKGSTISAKVLQQRAADFRAATGKPPSIVDLVGEEGAETIADVTFRGKEANRALAQAAAERAVGLQDELSDAIVKGRKTPAVTKLDQYRKIAADRVMSKIEDRRIKFDPDAVKALTEPRDVRTAIPEFERDLLFAIEDSGGDLSVRDVDNIRLALRKKSKGAGGPSARIRKFAKALVDDTADQVPEYGRYLKSFARRSRGIEGAEFGRKVLSDSPTEFSATAEQLAEPGLGGARVGARAQLSDTARQSPAAAAKLAVSLAEDSGLAQKLESLDPAEAARLRRLGNIEKQSIRGVAEVGRRAEQNLSKDDSAATRAAIDTLLSSTGAGSLSFKVAAFRRFLSINRVPPNAAEKLAKDLVDPAKTDDTLRRLAALGVAPRKVEEFARSLGRAGGRAVSGQKAGEE